MCLCFDNITSEWSKNREVSTFRRNQIVCKIFDNISIWFCFSFSCFSFSLDLIFSKIFLKSFWCFLFNFLSFCFVQFFSVTRYSFVIFHFEIIEELNHFFILFWRVFIHVAICSESRSNDVSNKNHFRVDSWVVSRSNILIRCIVLEFLLISRCVSSTIARLQTIEYVTSCRDDLRFSFDVSDWM